MLLEKEGEKRGICRPRQKSGNLLWMENKPHQTCVKGCKGREVFTHTQEDDRAETQRDN